MSLHKDAVEVVDSPQKTIQGTCSTNTSNDGSQKDNSLNIRVHNQDCIPARISKSTKRAEITALKDIHLPVLWPEGNCFINSKNARSP